jgi:formylglycine-generating enzyme required for sulfatase activity
LQDGSEGPILVVVPAGGPLTAPLAIGKYEISVESYNQYCKGDPACAPNGTANDLYYPVTGITIAQAEAYIDWLSRQTGQAYRLPANNEWDYAAAARDKWPDRNRNCQANAGADSKGGSPSLSAVNAGGTVNAWGLFHHLDNVREWVRVGNDIYVRGGSYVDAIDDCSIRLSEPHAGLADPYTGFRIVREIRR